MKTEQGFIKTIILVVVALIIISFLGIDIKQVIDSPTTQHNFSYVTQGILYIWDHFLKVPVLFLWNLFLSTVVNK